MRAVAVALLLSACASTVTRTPGPAADLTRRPAGKGWYCFIIDPGGGFRLHKCNRELKACESERAMSSGGAEMIRGACELRATAECFTWVTADGAKGSKCLGDLESCEEHRKHPGGGGVASRCETWD